MYHCIVTVCDFRLLVWGRHRSIEERHRELVKPLDLGVPHLGLCNHSGPVGTSLTNFLLESRIHGFLLKNQNLISIRKSSRQLFCLESPLWPCLNSPCCKLRGPNSSFIKIQSLPGRFRGKHMGHVQCLHEGTLTILLLGFYPKALLLSPTGKT